VDQLITRGLVAKRESKYVEFKHSFDTGSTADWCEIIKDIVAMCNSGGGVILFGLDNKGNLTGFDPTPILNFDPAVLTDKVSKYTGVQFSEFEIVEGTKGRRTVAILRVYPRRNPIIFNKPGTYEIRPGKQKTAFSQGTLYFRHGAKSEPADSTDLRKFIDKRIEEVRSDVLKGVQQVIDAPPGAKVVVLSEQVFETESEEAFPIRIVEDPSAPQYRKIDTDKAFPYRQKELIREVNKKLPEGVRINRHDVLSVRRMYDVDENTKFCYAPLYSSQQYSQAFADWMLDRYSKDKEFFQKARAEYRRLRK
jgi:hypothetical protein